MEPIITTHGLSKTYGRGSGAVRAITDLDLQVMPGEIFGLFGPNGAGKSTLVRVLTTLLAPTQGTATVAGHDIVSNGLSVRASCGLVTSDDRSFYGRLSAERNLSFFAAMQNVARREVSERVAWALDLFGLADKARATTQSLSTGQRQRLNMARALIHDPPILFLDEPTKSMDVQTSDFVKQLVKEELSEKLGKTIIFISHELYEMDDFCDRVLVLADGRAKVVGTPVDLAARLPRTGFYRVVIQGDASAIRERWTRIDGVKSAKVVSEGISTTAFDLELADDSAWLSVMQAVDVCDGRVERFAQVDDQSLRRIVAHFSNDAPGPEGARS